MAVIGAILTDSRPVNSMQARCDRQTQGEPMDGWANGQQTVGRAARQTILPQLGQYAHEHARHSHLWQRCVRFSSCINHHQTRSAQYAHTLYQWKNLSSNNNKLKSHSNSTSAVVIDGKLVGRLSGHSGLANEPTSHKPKLQNLSMIYKIEYCTTA